MEKGGVSMNNYIWFCPICKDMFLTRLNRLHNRCPNPICKCHLPGIFELTQYNVPFNQLHFIILPNLQCRVEIINKGDV